MLVDAGHDVSGLDTGFFEGCDFGPAPAALQATQRDLRDVTSDDLAGFDAVVHLAALSNDPLGNLDEDGYLKTSIEEIAQVTAYTEEEITEVLHAIQKFDPVGIAARDTRECLLIQVKFQDLAGTIVEKILLDHMDKLENRNQIESLAQQLVDVKQNDH